MEVEKLEASGGAASFRGCCCSEVAERPDFDFLLHRDGDGLEVVASDVLQLQGDSVRLELDVLDVVTERDVDGVGLTEEREIFLGRENK